MQTMIMWFCKLFQPGFTPEKIVSPTPTPANVSNVIRPAVEPAPLPLPDNQVAPIHTFSGDYQQLPMYVDACYFDWLAGKTDESVNEDSSFEGKILEYLRAVAESELAGSNLIPRVPSVMVQLLKRLHEEDVSGAELSRIISQDVVLVAGLLNEVNSAFYNLADKISDISQAILLLGHTRLRMVLAKISFTPIYSAQIGANTRLAASKIWDQSQKRAQACSLLAKSQNDDPFMAFLTGLMQDVGLIVALRVFDRSGNGQLPTSANFREEFQRCAHVLSARIATIWSLPENVVTAIESLDMDTTVSKSLADVLHRGDFLSKTCTLIEAEQLSVDMDLLKATLSESEIHCLVALLQEPKQA